MTAIQKRPTPSTQNTPLLQQDGMESPHQGRLWTLKGFQHSSMQMQTTVLMLLRSHASWRGSLHCLGFKVGVVLVLSEVVAAKRGKWVCPVEFQWTLQTQQGGHCWWCWCSFGRGGGFIGGGGFGINVGFHWKWMQCILEIGPSNNFIKKLKKLKKRKTHEET